jgi:hypothetical protein
MRSWECGTVPAGSQLHSNDASCYVFPELALSFTNHMLRCRRAPLLYFQWTSRSPPPSLDTRGLIILWSHDIYLIDVYKSEPSSISSAGLVKSSNILQSCKCLQIAHSSATQKTRELLLPSPLLNLLIPLVVYSSRRLDIIFIYSNYFVIHKHVSTRLYQRNHFERRMHHSLHHYPPCCG